MLGPVAKVPNVCVIVAPCNLNFASKILAVGFGNKIATSLSRALSLLLSLSLSLSFSTLLNHSVWASLSLCPSLFL